MSMRSLKRMAKKRASVLITGAICTGLGLLMSSKTAVDLQTSAQASIPYYADLSLALSVLVGSEGMSELVGMFVKKMMSVRTWKKMKKKIKVLLRVVTMAAGIAAVVYFVYTNLQGDLTVINLRQNIWMILGLCLMVYGIGIFLAFVSRHVLGWFMHSKVKILVCLVLCLIFWKAAESGMFAELGHLISR